MKISLYCVLICSITLKISASSKYFPDAEQLVMILQKYPFFQKNPEATFKVTEKFADQPKRDWTYESMIDCMHVIAKKPAVQRHPSIPDFRDAVIEIVNHPKQD